MFTITKNYVTEGYCPTVNEMPLYGIERALGESSALPRTHGATVEFQMFDDNGELYYEGVLDDDAACANQTAALRWGEADAGCTTIKVKRGGEWVQEIG